MQGHDFSSPSSAFVLGGSVLDPELDAELANIAADAARVTLAPITVVTLMLDRGRAYRARYQLPTHLVVSRGGDRDVALCDLVAMTGATLEILDATREVDLPREVADCTGLRACLCVPVLVAGAPVGALCVVDLVARPFTDDQRAALERLAARAGKRAAAIAAERRARALVLVQSTTAPVLGELRAMMERVGGDAADRLGRVAAALDAALTGGDGPVTLARAAAAAESLAFAATGPVGGVRWVLPEDASLGLAPSLAAAAISAALTAVAARLAAAGAWTGMTAIARVDGVPRISIEADGLDAAAAAACAAEVLQALGGDPQVTVLADDGRLHVRLPRA